MREKRPHRYSDRVVGGNSSKASGTVQILQEKNDGAYRYPLFRARPLRRPHPLLCRPHPHPSWNTQRGGKRVRKSTHAHNHSNIRPPRDKSSLNLSSSQPRTAHARDKSSVHLPWSHYKNDSRFLSATFQPLSAHGRIFEESYEETRTSIDVAGSTAECPHRTLPIRSSRYCPRGPLTFARALRPPCPRLSP